MKILMVSHEFPPIGGGGANACYFLSKGFVKLGHDVTIVTSAYKDLPERECVNGATVIRVKAQRNYMDHCSFQEMVTYLIKALPETVKLQKVKKFNICLVFFGIPSGPIGYYLKRRYHIPYLIRFGGGDVPGGQKRFALIYKLLSPAIKIVWKNADQLIANSDGLKKRALSFYKTKRMNVIFNGVDETVFFPDESKKKSDRIQILFVSRLLERKGLQDVIPLLKLLTAPKGRRIELKIVGDGPYRAELERIVIENQVENIVRFTGILKGTAIVESYQAADVFILPSRSEGMPNVVLEAMACGLPVLMTPCEGSKELIDGNGYVIEMDMFLNKLQLLIENEELRIKFGKRSRELINAGFLWQNIVALYNKQLISVLKDV